jgi:hypothetical protein
VALCKTPVFGRTPLPLRMQENSSNISRPGQAIVNNNSKQSLLPCAPPVVLRAGRNDRLLNVYLFEPFTIAYEFIGEKPLGNRHLCQLQGQLLDVWSILEFLYPGLGNRLDTQISSRYGAGHSTQGVAVASIEDGTPKALLE